MVELAAILDRHLDAFLAKYADRLLPSHLSAIAAIRRCRTPDSGELYVQCTACDEAQWRPLSCGHRSCPKCQNYEASQWLDRQQAKLLPVDYFQGQFVPPHKPRRIADPIFFLVKQPRFAYKGNSFYHGESGIEFKSDPGSPCLAV